MPIRDTDRPSGLFRYVPPAKRKLLEEKEKAKVSFLLYLETKNEWNHEKMHVFTKKC